MIKYNGWELSEEEYYRHLFCNGLQRYRRKMRDEVEGESIFHECRDVGDTFTERCAKCGMTRFINKFIGVEAKEIEDVKGD